MTINSIQPEVLGERLRMARSKANLTQEAAAQELGFARTTLLAIEAGKRRLQSLELANLARLYSTTVGYLLSPDSVHVDLAAQFRRVGNAATDQKAIEAIALLNSLVAGAVELERALGVHTAYDYPPPVRISNQGYFQQAEDAALALRGRLGVGLGKIDDLLSLLELDLGIRVFFRPLPAADIAGLYAFESAIGACILVNSNHHWHRRVQTLAHETGHFVSDRSHADVLDQYGFHLSTSEKFARRFGAALLMPAPAVRSRFDQLVASTSMDVRALILLGHQFGVATEAICRRLEDLELLAEGTWLSIRDRGYNTNLERDVLGDPRQEQQPALVSPRLTYLAAEALARGLLSEGQLCQMLVVDRVQLRRVLAPFQAGD